MEAKKISLEKMQEMQAAMKKGEIADAIVAEDPIEAVPDVAPALLAPGSRGGQPLWTREGISVGSVVLFRIDRNLPIWRPLLVSIITPEGGVYGNLFLQTTYDGAYAWPQEHLFVQLNDANRIVEVHNVQFGEEMGQWKPR